MDVLGVLRDLPHWLGQHLPFLSRRDVNGSEFITRSVVLGSVGILTWLLLRNLSCYVRAEEESDSTDTGLFSFNSQRRSYTVSGWSYVFLMVISSFLTESVRLKYRNLRVIYRVHPSASKFPFQLPLLVFVHGLGGQAAQFRYLIDHFAEFSSILAIDLPGCGESEFQPLFWDAYTTSALVNLLEAMVTDFLLSDQCVVLIGHSMGCSLNTLLAGPHRSLSKMIVGVIAICPKVELSSAEKDALRRVAKLPGFVFDMLRVFDRRGGIHSPSVRRFVSPSSDDFIRELQLHFNTESKTPVWRRMATGLQLPAASVWSEVQCPILLCAAKDDFVTPSFNANQIFDLLQEFPRDDVKLCEVPNAGHAVIYEKYQLLSGIISDFLQQYVQESLSLGWQLDFIKEDKWMLKNLLKWQNTESYGAKIPRTPFIAMKTMRQSDELHNPLAFSSAFHTIKHIIDLSHEDPPYDPSNFQNLGILYHKCLPIKAYTKCGRADLVAGPTVSKIPPTIAEVTAFISLVDSICLSKDFTDEKQPIIACHCHYGFNRTGFFVCSYMVARLGFGVQEAIDAFRQSRSPGIRHQHFIDQLFVRYCMK